jgi:probable phosphoglycerate mutase
MPTILLIRHGENDYVKKKRLAGRLPGVRLNERGKEQAQELAQALKKLPIKAVYSSPLERSTETAHPIAKIHRLRVEKRTNLIETDLGDWQGKIVTQLGRNKQWRMLQENPARFRFPGGEWMVEQQARLVAEIETLCARHKPKDYIAVVGHADPIKLIIAHFVGLPLDLFQRLAVETASVSTLVINKRGARLLSLNWTAKDIGAKSV